VQFELELDGIEHIAKFVAEGLGVSILPDWPTIGSDRGVKRWALPPPCPSRIVGLLWLRSSARAQLSQAFAAVLQTGALKEKLKKTKIKHA
jgi:DNA-binding transcriptional LysR family regulator